MLSQVVSQGRYLVAEFPIVAATGALLVGMYIYYRKVIDVLLTILGISVFFILS